MRIYLVSAFIIFIFFSQNSYAEIKNFSFNSITHIEEANTNNKFILTFWSINCAPCLKELSLFKESIATYDDIKLVLVNTDNLEFLDDANEILTEHSLHDEDNWIFAESNTDKLRFHIDKMWAGELPRSYFYEKNKDRVGISGLIPHDFIITWLNNN